MAIRSILWNGQSYLVSIPPAVANAAGLKQKDKVFVEVHEGPCVVITKCPGSSADLAKAAKAGGNSNA